MNQMSVVTPTVGQVFRSHQGKGKYRARVRFVHNGRVYLLHLHRKRGSEFDLPLWYFGSKACGWR